MRTRRSPVSRRDLFDVELRFQQVSWERRMNTYVSVDTLEISGVLNITESGDDARLRGLEENRDRVGERVPLSRRPVRLV